jgi:hypothetical protein
MSSLRKQEVYSASSLYGPCFRREDASVGMTMRRPDESERQARRRYIELKS